MKIKKNKKAAELNITVIIVVILAVLALVVVALFFTGGMGKMTEWITQFWKGTGGIEKAAAISQCSALTSNKYLFCCDKINVRGMGEVTCSQLGESVMWEGFSAQAKNLCLAYDCGTE